MSLDNIYYFLGKLYYLIHELHIELNNTSETLHIHGNSWVGSMGNCTHGLHNECADATQNLFQHFICNAFSQLSICCFFSVCTISKTTLSLFQNPQPIFRGNYLTDHFSLQLWSPRGISQSGRAVRPMHRPVDHN